MARASRRGGSGTLKVGPGVKSRGVSVGSMSNGVPSRRPHVVMGLMSTPGAGDGVATNPYPCTCGDAAVLGVPRKSSKSTFPLSRSALRMLSIWRSDVAIIAHTASRSSPLRTAAACAGLVEAKMRVLRCRISFGGPSGGGGMSSVASCPSGTYMSWLRTV